MGTDELSRSVGDLAALQIGEARSTARPAPANTDACNVARFLPETAARQPDALALRVPRGRDATGQIRYFDLNFAGLDREADAWAVRLTQRGVAQGTRVLLLVQPGLSLLAICFALFKIGAVPVVIDPGMGVNAFLRCVARTAPAALVAVPRGIWLARLFRRTFGSVRARIQVRPHAPLAAGDAAGVARFPVAPTRGGDLAAILFTSGSTGAPKGVCYEHGMFEAQVRAIRDTYGIAPGEIDLPMLPVFALFNPALGLTTVVPEINPSRPAGVEPLRIVAAINQCGVTTSFGSPVLWRKVADCCLENHCALPSLRRVLMAGAAVPPQLMADLKRVAPNVRVHAPYGATEALPVSTITDREAIELAVPSAEQGRGTCVGRALPGVDVKIIRISDEPIERWDERLVLPAGRTGEIVVCGATVTKSYDQLPQATAAAKITAAGAAAGESPLIWHRMGDLGYLDDAGRLWFCGRKAERVITDKEVLFTECCEPVFNRHPRVARSALIGLGFPGRQEAALVVEPKPGAWPRNPIDRASFAEELRTIGLRCATTRDIHLFFFHRHFPVDVRHNAKIHRLALARHFARKRPVSLP